jgi:hypothetical protein
MNIDKKIIEELKRFNQINSYILKEQVDAPAPEGELPPAPEGELPPAPEGEVPPAPPAGDATSTEAPPAEEVAEPIDVESDPDVEEVDAEKESVEGESEEIDITDLVTNQQEIKTKQDEFMDGMFTRLDDLENKLNTMDQIMDKINSLENKFDKYREKTPEEKLMLRSLDSYPYNQKLTDFFQDKEVEMEKTGKNEYILTSDDVENFSPNEIKKTFNIYDDEKQN